MDFQPKTETPAMAPMAPSTSDSLCTLMPGMTEGCIRPNAPPKFKGHTRAVPSFDRLDHDSSKNKDEIMVNQAVASK